MSSLDGHHKDQTLAYLRLQRQKRQECLSDISTVFDQQQSKYRLNQLHPE
jgi:hypothetical protein